MAKPELRSYYGEANFRLDAGAVTPLSVEQFNLATDSEARDFVQASINKVQGRKRAEQLEAHFNLLSVAEGEV